MKTLRSHFPILAGLLIASTAGALGPADLSDPRVVEAFVDGVVKQEMADGNSPSGAFALMKDGEVVFAKGYGWQDVEKRIPVDPRKTLFRPGSISKLFTWVSVMQLVERGQLDLDADINSYLDSFQIEDSYPGEPVTLRHCMTHTPGFEDGALGYLIIEDEEDVIPLADAMKKYQPRRVNPPGRVSAYSNYCTALSGLVVSNVSGTSFEEYVEKNIFEVLGMEHSTFREPLPEHLEADMAVAYKYEDGSYVARPFELIGNFGPAGGLSATLPDLLEFGAALMAGGESEGGSILRAETVAEMNEDQFTYDESLKGVGLGFLHYPYGQTDTFGHDGGTTAFFSHLGITPSADLVVASSFSGPGGPQTYAALVRAFYEEFFPKPDEAVEPPADFESRAARYAGSYLPWRRSFTKLESLMALVSQTEVVPTEGQLLIDGKRHVEVAENLFRNVENGDLIAFQADDDGEVVGLARDGWPFVSLYKGELYDGKNFNFALLGLSAIVLLAVVFRGLYQRDRFKAMSDRDRGATRAAFWTAVSHLLAVVLFGITLVAVGDQLMARIPPLLTIWLFTPILAALLTLYLLYQAVQVWRGRLLKGVFARARYSVVALCALFMTWFYYYWSILGFNYY